MLEPVNRLSSCAMVPESCTVPVPSPELRVTPESPTTTVRLPSPTLRVATAPLSASSPSATLKPVPSILKFVCSVALRAPAGAVTTGASLTAVMLTVVLPVAVSVPSLKLQSICAEAGGASLLLV